MSPTLKKNLIVAVFLCLMSPNIFYIFQETFPGGWLLKIHFSLLAMMLLAAPLLFLPLQSYLVVLIPLGLLIPLCHLNIFFTGKPLDAAAANHIMSLDWELINTFISKNMNAIVISGLFTVVYWTACFCIFHAPIELKFSGRFKAVFMTTTLFLQFTIFQHLGASKHRELDSQELVSAVVNSQLNMPGIFPTDTLWELSKAILKKARGTKPTP